MNKNVFRGFGVGLVLVLALSMGAGCALTDYSLITDDDQLSNPNLTSAAHTNIVNTAGKSYVRQSLQVATLYPDGADNLIWFVDQKTNGDRTLDTSNFFTSLTAPSPFKDDLYCSPDWSGCSIATSDDPEIGDVDDYDYAFHPSCSGARSLALLVSTTRYYGECGRADMHDRSATMLSLASEMKPGQLYGTYWLRTTLTAMNTSIVLNNRVGDTFSVPISSQVGVSVNFGTRKLLLDMTNPNNRSMAQSVLDWNAAHPGPALDATVTINGHDLGYHMKVANNAPNWLDGHYGSFNAPAATRLAPRTPSTFPGSMVNTSR